MTEENVELTVNSHQNEGTKFMKKCRKNKNPEFIYMHRSGARWSCTSSRTGAWFTYSALLYMMYISFYNFCTRNYDCDCDIILRNFLFNLVTFKTDLNYRLHLNLGWLNKWFRDMKWV